VAVITFLRSIILQIDLNRNNIKVCASDYILSESYYVQSDSFELSQMELQIKKQLASQLVEHLFKEGHIEFTRERRTDKFEFIFRARIVTVDNNVLRELSENRII